MLRTTNERAFSSNNRQRRVSTQRLLFFACFLLACVLLAFYLIVFVYGDRLIDALAYLLGVDRSAFVFASLSAAPTLAPQTQSEKAAAYMAELVKPTPPPRGCPATFQDGLKNVPLPYEDIDKTEGAVTACGLRYQMFVLHAANWNLTRHVMEYMSAELPDSQLVLIDATINEETRLYRKEIEHFKIEVMYPRIPLSLAAGMEFIRRTAFSRGLDFVFYSHNDAQYTRSGIMKEALEGVCRFDKEHNNWGLLKFNYDIFCAYNMKAFKATGMWDPYIPNYKADFDYYRRMQCAGYTVISYDKPEPGISVLHKTSMTLKTLQQQSKEQQYGWWLTDEVGRYLYFWAKWNTDIHPWLDEQAYSQPWDDKSPPNRSITPRLMLRFAWRYHWPLIVSVIAIPYTLLMCIGLCWCRRCFANKFGLFAAKPQKHAVL